MKCESCDQEITTYNSLTIDDFNGNIFTFKVGDYFGNIYLSTFILQLDRLESDAIYFHSLFIETKEVIQRYKLSRREFLDSFKIGGCRTIMER